MALPSFFGYGVTVNAETTVTDNARRMPATFGSPTIGGTDIDSIWNDVQAVVPTIVSKATTF